MATRGKQAKVTEISYLAGIIDADGCISVSKMKAGKQRTANPRYVLTVNVVNTSEDLMQWLVSTFGGRFKVRRKASMKHKATYDWWFNNGKAADLLRLVKPHLRIKRDRAELGISFIEGWVRLRKGPGTRTPPEEVARRERCYLEMKSLNQFGPRSRND
jgi:hypothetical protein